MFVCLYVRMYLWIILTRVIGKDRKCPMPLKGHFPNHTFSKIVTGRRLVTGR